MPDRPNILYIHSHDTGRYVQPYGYAIPTPNIQNLAEQGVLFRRAFCGAPTCSPSRACLLTGQSAHSSGMLGLAHRGFSLKDYSQHIIHTLAREGYSSTLIGVQHIAKDSSVIGYDTIVSTPSNRAEHVAPAAARFLDDRPREPFFLSVGFSETHREYPRPKPGEEKYCSPPAPIPDTPETRRDMAGFRASARLLDLGIGKVIPSLDSSGLGERTIVICTTDHGIAFPSMKCNLTDHGIGVMMIIRGGPFEGGRVVDSLVSQLDLFPTICDLLNIDTPPWVEGRSIVPIIRGETEEVNQEIFAEVTYHASYEPQRAVRTRRWKYIRRFDDRSTPVLANCDDSPSKDLWLRNGWASRTLPSEQLYDLIFDPHETCNLATNPAFREVLQDMRRRLDRWMRMTHDPLLEGPVRPPTGAIITDPGAVSPKGPKRVAP